uniref:Midasin n=1 Tax=Globodera rostochiensis TaxID=31243 RepID=A0A914HG94_GLORO
MARKSRLKKRKCLKTADEEVLLLSEKRSKMEAAEEETFSSEVEHVAALLETKKLVILQGPHGCGKTHTAGQVAHRRSIPIKVLQINDQYDSKVLYGSYNCSEVPGAFLWQPSKFAQFLQQPCVILLKNLDHGGPDLAAAIIDLAERGHAALANGRHIRMATECRILGALSTDDHHHNHHLQQLWRDYPFTVKMGPIQPPQMDSILAATTKIHSELDNVRVKLLETFTAVSELILARKTSMDRALNAKDLFRVVRRLVEDHQQHTSVTDRCALFAELFDGWAAHLTDTELRPAIGEALSLSTEQQHYHMNVRHPDVSFLEENGVQQRVQIGRITLDRHEQQHSAERSTNRPFVHTRDAAQLLERVAACVARSPPEPVLLTGDTGVGKTAIVQHIAHLSRIPLHVVNLSQESEFTDLVGGHKPTSATNILRPLVDDYVSLFRETFDAEKNAKFLDNLNHCFNAHRFADLVQLVIKSSSRALQKFAPVDACDTRRSRWTLLRQRARRLAKCFRPGGDDDGAWRRRLLFAHVKGVLTEAAERGDWLLVDEINLAPVECMDALVELLDPSSDFIVHANFRLFACMNSANDVGKRVLPLGIRSAFTEFYVDETRDEDQLRKIIRGQILSMNENMVEAVLQFYMDVRLQFPGQFNLRTLSRALAVANDQQLQLGTAKHCLHRACAVAFVSQLDAEQRKRMQLLVTKWLGDVPTLARNGKLSADEMRKFVLIEGHKIPRGNEMPMFSDIAGDIAETDSATTGQSTYIFTPSVRANMALLASVVATGHFPILMEGETSAGKTSMVMQLAKMSGNRCFRINNHEHTDVQEYIGSYAPDATGRLEFVEGVLLRAVRNGDWIILDELNLAPSSVLEALNRLLDDNRELFVSELNVAVRAHPRFRLFATQNPVGTYAGRKRLSRAFLSRFMCLQWDALPHAELPQIVQRRCGVSPKMAQLMADVLAELKVRRAIGGIFSSSDGLMTLRDLFRWGHRMSSALVDGQATADWRQALADQGYFVLGTRCRTKQDEQAVVDVLKRLLDPKIDFSRLFGAESPYMPSAAILPGLSSSSTIVLTAQMRRMLILCAEAWRRNEPILLVGETGCGKTTAVHQFGHLLSINCHERTDAADLLGSIRPITADDDGGGVGGFRWRDGIVLQAMRRGQRLLIDEISLAPDSVLERLNSLLEPQRAILLTDAGAQSGGDETVTAADGFQLVATMNPGNDHGKKELSKALRNRFTEVWCPAEHDRNDLLAIVRHRFEKLLVVDDQQQLNGQIPVDKVAQLLIKFYEFFNSSFNDLLRFSLSTRDLVTLSELFANFYISGIPVHQALYHAIESNLLDALGVLPSRFAFDRQEVIDSCIKQLHTLIMLELGEDFTAATASSSHVQQQLELNANALSIGLFRIQCNRQDGGDIGRCRLPVGFSLDAPTTRRNAMRVARALASSKPVMLEGSPGAGKSSLVVALAAATGHKLVRLNLSEQTDLHDLFGGDVPVPDSDGSASFAWRDGPVLKAIKEGSWILLDEMNLASQSVLEGLNSCFDFRKRIYIAELDRTFELDSSRCKFFACQNPHQQGGARRALPKSFLNRFISIFVEEMTDDDFIHILCAFCKAQQQQQQQMADLMDNIDDDGNLSSPLFTEDRLAKMVLVNKLCRERVRELHHCGGPFEFNLRDLFRWVEAVDRFGGNFAFGFELVYLSRLTRQSAKDTVS